LVGGGKILGAAVFDVSTAPGIGGVIKLAERFAKREITVHIAAKMGDGGLPKISRINALRKQGESAEKIQILGIRVEAMRGFDFAASNPEPTPKAVIGDGPVQDRVILPELPKIPVIELGSNPQSICDIGGDIDREVGKCAAALIAVHGQPIIGTCVNETLRCEAMHFNLATVEAEILRQRLARIDEWKREKQSSD
jgi:hypothetical protein